MLFGLLREPLERETVETLEFSNRLTVRFVISKKAGVYLVAIHNRMLHILTEDLSAGEYMTGLRVS